MYLLLLDLFCFLVLSKIIIFNFAKKIWISE